MADLFHKPQDEISIDDVQRLIDTGAEETLSLDFKAAGALSFDTKKKKEISKDVSAFANSEGGMLIYGVHEEKQKAHSLDPVDGETFTRDWLEQVISGTIHRPIEGFEVIPIRIEGDLQSTVYIVRIPDSYHAPHMANDGHYYLRSNARNRMMEEYQVRQAYFKQRAAQLEFKFYPYLGYNNSAPKLEEFDLYFIVEVLNSGPIREDKYKFEFFFPSLVYSKLETWGKTELNQRYKCFLDQGGRVCSRQNDESLFPNEKDKDVIPGFKFDKGANLRQIREQTVVARLYYSGGKEEKELNLSNVLKIGDKDITTLPMDL
ncbi:MAG: helix-turn-helix domain-containing protein [Flavobacteriales bacterium]